jgi:Ca2+-transporting ATPase
VTRGFLLKVLGNGALIGLGCLVVFISGINLGYGDETARTMAFSTMAIGQLFHIFNVRTKNTFGIDRTILKNPYLIGAFLISIVLQLAAVYLPFLNRVLETVPLDFYKWMLILAGSVVPTIIIQLFRLYRQRAGKS